MRGVDSPSRCGSYVLFNSGQGEPHSLIRVDSDGLNPKKPGSGSHWSPVCSPDGQCVFYADLTARPQRILKISIDGGSPTEVGKAPGDEFIGTLAVSPDGKYLAIPYHELGPPPKSTLVVIPVTGGATVRTFPNIAGKVLSSPTGDGIYHYEFGLAARILEQPFAGGKARIITTFPEGQGGNFSWSVDGKQL